MLMRRKANRYTLSLLFIFCASFSALGQDQNINAYLDRRIKANISSRIDQTDPTKQADPPAASANSTSLVERSSAPDLIGFGLDFLNLSDSSADKKAATPKTLTFSGYAVKSLFAREDPLDPEIYNRPSSRALRSISFTAGYDVPENTDAREPIVGIKWLAYNGRDISTARNQEDIGQIQGALKTASRAFSELSDEVELYLLAALKRKAKPPVAVGSLDALEKAVADKTTWPVILDSLTDEEKKGIDGIISKHISAFVNLDTVSGNVVNTIRARPQLALAFTTTQRKGTRPDEYSAVVTFDKGMGASSITVNGSFIFTTDGGGKDSKGGKFAAAFHLPLQGFKPLQYTDPLLLTIEADATGMTGTTPTYRAQAKVTIPVLPGMAIPISVSVANRTELVKESEVKGKFGFTFDVSKALKAFRDAFQRRK